MLKQQLLAETKSYKNLPQLILICICLCLSAFYYGFCLNETSTISQEIYIQFFGQISVQPVMSGVLIGILAIGGGAGALLAPFIISLIPSRKCFLLLFNCVAIMAAGIIQINSFTLLMICRLFQGFVVGSSMGVIPAYIKQLTPIPLRGAMGAMSQFFIVGGGVLIFSLQVIFVKVEVSNEFFWRFMFSFTGITVIIQSIFLLFNIIPQSPLSCIEAGNKEQAMEILSRFNSPEAAKIIFDQFMLISKRYGDQQRNKIKQQSNTAKNIQMSRHTKSEISDDSEKPKTIDNFVLNSKKEIINSNIQLLVQQKSKIPQNNNFVPWNILLIACELPLMQQFNGNKVISTEASMILSQYSKILGLYAPLITNLIIFIAVGCSFYIISKFGRRPLLLLGNLALTIICFILGAMFYALANNGNNNIATGAMVFIVLFMFIYGITVGPIVWLYVPEIVPPRIVPFATFNYWAGVAISMAITPIVIGKVGSSYPLFFFFGTLSLIFLIINYFLVVQTKNQEVKNI